MMCENKQWLQCATGHYFAKMQPYGIAKGRAIEREKNIVDELPYSKGAMEDNLKDPVIKRNGIQDQRLWQRSIRLLFWMSPNKFSLVIKIKSKQDSFPKAILIQTSGSMNLTLQ